MSSDWSKYATPAEARARKGQEKAANNAIVSLVVGELRNLPNTGVQRVVHAPEDHNRAHAVVHGEKTERIRKLFARMARMEIRITDSVAG